jgi:hypothetical protein
MENESPSLSGLTDIGPSEVHPEINEDKRDSDIKEPSHRILRGGSNATLVLESIARFNTKPLAIILMNRS